MKKHTLALVILCLVQITAFAQINSFKVLTKQPRQYAKTDIEVNLTGTWENPYLQQDVALDMLIISPTGKKLALPCYYETGESGKPSVWKARFAPQETGKYTYSFKFSKAGGEAQTSKTGTFIAAASKKNGFLHTKNNWILQFDNGKPYRGVAENICWESRTNDDSKFFSTLHENPKYNYEYMLKSFAAHGGDFFRTWMCQWNLPIDWKNGFNNSRYQSTTEYFNPGAVKKMDRLVTLSDSLGLYVMLTMGPGAYHTRDGGFSPNAADFFVNPRSKERYKNRLRYIVARWGYSTSIGAWEFFNEVDNVQFSNKNKPISADSIVQWHDEMSTYLKQIDPYRHIVTTSISHRDLKGLNSLKNIDINQKHIYKNTAIIPSTINKYEAEFKKPYVIGEFGYEYDWSKNFDEFADGMDSDFKRGLWYGLFSPTPILPMSWWWEYFDNRGTDAYYTRVRKITDMMMVAGKGKFTQIPVTVKNTGVKIFAVKCGLKTFIYAYNENDSIQQITTSIPGSKSAAAQVFNCETGKFGKEVKVSALKDTLTLSSYTLPAKTDVIFVIN